MARILSRVLCGAVDPNSSCQCTFVWAQVILATTDESQLGVSCVEGAALPPSRKGRLAVHFSCPAPRSPTRIQVPAHSSHSMMLPQYAVLAMDQAWRCSCKVLACRLSTSAYGSSSTMSVRAAQFNSPATGKMAHAYSWLLIFKA
eukprot:148050-Pleurochrysis_carterae.AAC.3